MEQKKEIITAIKYLLITLLLLWVVEIINLAFNNGLNRLGIMPRSLEGLKGIILSPFIHANIRHLVLNSLPLLILGSLTALHGKKVFISVSVFIIIFAGTLTWLFGRSSYHIGISSLVFGYFGFLTAYGFFNRSFLSIFIAALTIFLYGGIIWSVFPVNPYISWEGHFFGLLAGIVVAGLMKPVPKEQEKQFNDRI